MTTLFERDWLVRVNGQEIRGLSIEFEVKKTLHPEPNSCSLSIFGLAPESRRAVEELNLYDPKKIKGAKDKVTYDNAVAKQPTAVSRVPKPGKIRVEIEAGYKDARSLIFRGDLRRGITKYEGPEVRLEIEGEDGGRTMLSSRVTHSFPPGTRRAEVVRECAAALGLGLGNFLEVEPFLTQAYDSGTVVNGPAERELTGVLRRAKIGWSIQNGVLQFHRAGAGVQTRGLLISKETGLVGRPQRDSTGALMVETLLIPDVAPGQYFALQSEDYKGTYFMKSVTSKGESSGTPWYHTIEAYPG